MNAQAKAHWRAYIRERVQIDATTGCWVWQLSREKFGYGRAHGRVHLHGLSQYAHKLAYTVFVGPVPDGLQLRHRCHNPPCCNPKHLRIGTAQDNKDDNKKSGRFNSKLVLTAAQVAEIKRLLAAGGHTKLAISGAFGVSTTTIGDIARGRIWKNVNSPKGTP